MKDYVSLGKEKYYYHCPIPRDRAEANNGLYIIRMGETFPDPKYYIERNGETVSWVGGVFVLEYVIDGEGYIECDGNVLHIEKGDFYFLNCGYKHRYYSDRKAPLHKMWINVAGPFVAGIVKGIGFSEGVFAVKLEAEAYFRRMQSLLSTVDFKNRDKVYDRIALVITELMLFASSAKRTENFEGEDMIYEVKRYIDSEPDLSISLGDVCTRFYRNKSYLIARFRQEFGITPHKYILNKKMEAAKDMLSTSAMQIKEISQLLGFASPQYFASAFRSCCGKTPLEFRAEYHGRPKNDR